MAWIQMREDLAQDSKVLQLARSLSIKPTAVVGLLHALWSYASKHTEDGFLPGVTPVMIDQDIVHHDNFSEKLKEVGWLTFTKRGVKIPGFCKYMSQSSKARAGEAVRKRLQRSGMGAADMSGHCPDDVRTRARAPKSKGKRRTEHQGKAECTTDEGSEADGDAPDAAGASRSARCELHPSEQARHAAAAGFAGAEGAAGAAAAAAAGASDAAAALTRVSATDASAQCYAWLSSVYWKNKRVLTGQAVSRLCRKPGTTPVRVRFAIHRFREMIRKGHQIGNPGGLLWQLVTEAEVPTKFYEQEKTRALQAAAVKFAEREGIKVMNITDRS